MRPRHGLCRCFNRSSPKPRQFPGPQEASADRKSTRLKSSHPPRSTLFPYTTLFRSKVFRLNYASATRLVPMLQSVFAETAPVPGTEGSIGRSEEHTPEIQSPTEIYTLSLHDALPI